MKFPLFSLGGINPFPLLKLSKPLPTLPLSLSWSPFILQIKLPGNSPAHFSLTRLFYSTTAKNTYIHSLKINTWKFYKKKEVKTGKKKRKCWGSVIWTGTAWKKAFRSLTIKKPNHDVEIVADSYSKYMYIVKIRANNYNQYTIYAYYTGTYFWAINRA